MNDSPAPVSPDMYAVGDLIGGKYRLERLLGEGGQAWVWQARNLALDAQVAIKVLRDRGDATPQTRRLLQEARAAARLGHPAIVRVFDLGEASAGNPFLVMELLEGESLADRLVQSGRLTAIDAVRVLLPITDALRVAHAKGIVHRDLKPDNVFLTRGDETLQPKLVDFGIVKLQHTQDVSEQPTGAGMVVGSPAYLSPEQARGREDVDHRADVWGLCVTLYECVTGVVPFDGPNYNALLRKIVEDEPRSLSDHGVEEPELWQILRRGLAKAPEQRWQSALALGQSLAGWASARGVVDDVCRTPLELRWLRAGSVSDEPRLTSEAAVVDGATAAKAVLAPRWLAAALVASAVVAVVLLWNRAQRAPSADGLASSEAPPAARPSMAVEVAKPADSAVRAAQVELPPAASVAATERAVAPPDPSAPALPRVNAAASSARAPEPTVRKPQAIRAQGSGGMDLIIPY